MTSITPKRDILPRNVKPKHYRVSLEPDLEKYTYKGTVSIDLDVKETSSSVTLNALDIDIHEAFIGKSSAASISAIDEFHRVKFDFKDSFEKDSTITLDINFSGSLNDKMAGFYRSVSANKDGNKEVVATTQMEPTDCRRAFPCFDEPALKATFDITLIADPKYTALSNMDVKSERVLDNGKKETSFNTTPIMSTYLVAFIVGEFCVVENNSTRIPVRVYAPRGMEGRCQFSAELGAKTIEFFEKKFDVAYPLPKMDMVGIHEFSAGAMENWGLITYRLVDLLFDEAKDNAATKQRVAEVVQHEIAHQWFGNLVTMDWWEGLWLNEGFATWMSWYSCNAFYPEWKVWETYVVNDLQSALGLDGLRSSHPVQVPVTRADEINETFDAISYQKGSSIVKMVATYLGEENFLKGITTYLKRHAYGNATTNDLWKALSEVSNIDVVSLMDIWTTKVGYPVLTVSEEALNIKVRQNRYLTTGDVKPEEDETIYPLSLALRTKSGVDRSLMMDTREKEFSVDDDFYKINADQTGLYRVVYPADRVLKLSKAGQEGLLSVEDKVGLIADAASLSTSGYQKTSSLLDLISQWQSESEPNVWQEILARLTAVQSTFRYQSEEFQEAIRKLIRDLVNPKVKEYGLTFASSDSLLLQQIKASFYRQAINNGSQEYIDDALNRFRTFASGNEDAVDPNLRGGVFCAAGKYGTEMDWEFLLSIYKRPVQTSDGLRALQMLGLNSSIELKKKLLGYILDGTVMPHEATYAILGLTEDNEGAALTWNWFKDNFAEIKKKYPPSLGMLSSLLSRASGSPHTREKLEDFKKYFADKDKKGIERAINVTIDSSQAKLAWAERDRDDVSAWLIKHKYL